MFLTRAIFDNYVAVPECVTGEDGAGYLLDIAWMTSCGISLMPIAGVHRRIPVGNEAMRQRALFTFPVENVKKQGGMRRQWLS
jgi:hypothetical protein